MANFMTIMAMTIQSMAITMIVITLMSRDGPVIERSPAATMLFDQRVFV